jgi:hypothetical protein
MKSGSPSMLKATLIGGGLAGLMSSIPVVQWLNCVCCALVIGGGFLAAFIYAKDCRSLGVGFRPGEGALVGLVSALFFAIVVSLIGMLIRLVFPMDPADVMSQMEPMFEQFGMQGDQADRAVRVAEFFMSWFGAIVLFFIFLLVGAIFSTLGGLIGGAAFKVETAAPPASGGATPGA